MLVTRLQRTGRKKLASFSIVVQDSRRTPTSGKVAAYLGSYDPHTKNLKLDQEKVEFYLKNGAQPSERVILLLKKEKITLPAWVKEPTKKAKDVKSPEKRRSTAPEKPVEETPEVAEVSEDQAVVDGQDTQTIPEAPKEDNQA